MEALSIKRPHGGQDQILTNKRQRRSDSPRGLILNRCIDDEGGDSSVADAKTAAASCTSTGKPFSISFGIAAPPACCSLHLDWLQGGGTPCDGDGKHPNSEATNVRVIAGHDNALLIKMTMRVPYHEVRPAIPPPGYFPPPPTMRVPRPPPFLPPIADYFEYDYFVYEPAGCGARPPSLSLLPRFSVPKFPMVKLPPPPKFELPPPPKLPMVNVPPAPKFPMVNFPPPPKFPMVNFPPPPPPTFGNLGMENAAILRRGEDDLVLCQFETSYCPGISDMVHLCILRFGRDHEWTLKRVPILHLEPRHHDSQPWQKYPRFQPEHAVPVGNRFQCWVDYRKGFIVCDMVDEEAPKVRYAPLPATTQHDGDDADRYTLGAAGHDAVRFVSVSPPCCACRSVPGEGSSSPFNVVIWTMTLSTEEATNWVRDTVLSCDEIWKWNLPNYGCLPCDKYLRYPMVSPDDPDVIYFVVEGMDVAINTRSKKLLSVIPSSVRWFQTSITAKLCW